MPAHEGLASPPAASRRAMLVWGVAVAAYAVAVAHRSSFGVAGIDAADRYSAAATVLSLFTVVQLGVYAAAQLPVGVLLDRFGPRILIAWGAGLMALGQVGMALSHSVAVAISMRVLIGLGDAMTFVSVIRLVPSWFPPRRVPLLTQLTGILGQLGQVVSAVPFLLVLHHQGWATAFVALAILGVLAVVAVWALVRDRPAVVAPPDDPAMLPRSTTAEAVDGPATGTGPVNRHSPEAPSPAGLSAVVRSSGTWLGFWTHMVTSFSLNVFTLLWGYPFLVVGQGLTPGQASGLLTWNVVVGIIAGPVIGEFTARHPLRRSWAVLAIGGGVGVAWLLVLVPGTPRPLWVLAIFVTLLAVGGPGSVIGFDFARSANPPARLGAATGLVNVGGFSAAVLTVLAVGMVLDHVRPDGDYTLSDFRVALAVVVVPWAVAMIAVFVTRARTRAEMAQEGVVVPPFAEAWARWRQSGH